MAHALSVSQCSSFLTFAGTNVILEPSDITVDAGQYALFNCKYSCDAKRSHTLFWLVGDLPINQRTFLRGKLQRFMDRSGLHVEVEDKSSCERNDGGQAIEELRITANSTLYNKTSVQCVAYATSPNDLSFYSAYSLMIVNAPGEPASNENDCSFILLPMGLVCLISCCTSLFITDCGK
jgi:hypothetical protein